MWTLGSDFNYQNAFHWYHNLDKLVHYAKQDGRGVNLFYSTPRLYSLLHCLRRECIYTRMSCARSTFLFILSFRLSSIQVR